MYTTGTKCRVKYKEYRAVKKRGNQRKRIGYLRYAGVLIYSAPHRVLVMKELQSAYEIALELERSCPKPRGNTPTHYITLLDPSSSTLCPQLVFLEFFARLLLSQTHLFFFKTSQNILECCASKP